MENQPVEQVFCPHCQGGNPPDGVTCIWCKKPMDAIDAPVAASVGAGVQAADYSSDGADLPAVREKVGQILTKGEKIEYIAVESRPVQINIAPDCVVLTNRRFIIYRPRVFGQVEFEDYIWRNLRDARITEGVLRASFSVDTVDGNTIVVKDLMKEQARRVYQYAQEMEEYVIEERRQREMEEKRAASGGIYMQTPSAAPSPLYTPQGLQSQMGSSGGENPVEKLRQLKEMLDAGLITSAIYEAKRSEILSKM